MSVSSFDPNTQVVTVTPSAIEHFKAQLSQSSSSAVRLSVKESGCTGYMYMVDLIDASVDGDIHYELAEGVVLSLDPKAIEVVNGSQIDYVTEGVNKQIKFINPNAEHYCGCGESFSVKN